jgi:hypothetical protein
MNVVAGIGAAIFIGLVVLIAATLGRDTARQTPAPVAEPGTAAEPDVVPTAEAADGAQA